MYGELKKWLDELGSVLTVTQNGKRIEAVGMLSPHREGDWLACPKGMEQGVLAAEEVDALFLTRIDLDRKTGLKLIGRDGVYDVYACVRLAPQLYQARVQKEAGDEL